MNNVKEINRNPMTKTKSIFLFAALLVATLANAQVKKVWTGHISSFGSDVQVIDLEKGEILGNHFLSWRIMPNNDSYYDIVDASSLKVVKSFFVQEGDDLFLVDEFDFGPYFVSKGIFTTDGKWAALKLHYNYSNATPDDLGNPVIDEIDIVNEDNAIVASIPIADKNISNTEECIKLIKAGRSYYLAIKNPVNKEYDIYALPGSGSAR